MSRILGLFLVLAMLTACGQTHALNSGGKVKKQHNDGNGEGNAAEKKTGDAWQKEPLPAPENVALLSTTVFDRVSDDLDLTESQKKKIEHAKQEIRDAGEKIAKEQASARAAYEKAKKEKDCEAALERVETAAAACRGFAPQADFNHALARILTAEQFARFVQRVSKS